MIGNLSHWFFFEVDSDSVEVDLDCASDRGRAGAIVPPAFHRDYVPASIGLSTGGPAALLLGHESRPCR